MQLVTPALVSSRRKGWLRAQTSIFPIENQHFLIQSVHPPVRLSVRPVSQFGVSRWSHFFNVSSQEITECDVVHSPQSACTHGVLFPWISPILLSERYQDPGTTILLPRFCGCGCGSLGTFGPLGLRPKDKAFQRLGSFMDLG